MRELTASRILSLTGGRIRPDVSLSDAPLTSIVTDSRAAVPGCLFAALRGERVDGHRFIGQVIAAGAACVLAEDPAYIGGGPVILVPSVLTALQTIAGYYRQQFQIPFIGISGSVGKTTAKEMLSSVLSQRFHVHKTQGNFNNGLGVPLTLFGLHEDHECAVVEMGISDFGEMSVLADMVRPDIALFTNIGTAHLLALGDRAGVFRAKTEMLQYLAPGGTVLVNLDDDYLSTLAGGAYRTISFGIENQSADLTASDIRLDGNLTVCTVLWRGRTYPVKIPGYGEHMVYAALEGFAAGLALGMTPEEIVRGIADFETVGHRNRIISTGTLTIIDDCYNANPTSMRSAIRSMRAFPGRRICVLGDMLELGDKETEMHTAIGTEAAADDAISDVYTSGSELAEAIADGAGEKGHYYEDRDMLISALRVQLRAGDVVLVKASHSMQFEKITEAIQQFGILA